MSDWFANILKAKKSSITQNNLRKVHYLFENGREMVEEYNMDTSVLTRRAWRVKNELGVEGGWDIEIGDPEPKALQSDTEVIQESSNQPFISRRVTKVNLEWRIRNLPYPIEVYSVNADCDCSGMIVRTTNKKYYKKITIPELQRANVEPSQANISFTHKFNTLIITYKKPLELISLEKAIFEEVLKVKTKSDDDLKNCNPS